MISVIIPMYNNAGTILSCVGSLLEGSFKDFEIILSDDGSADDTLLVCEKIPDPRIRILKAEKNGGVSRARNRGLDAALGEYVSFVDADDTVTPDYLEKLYALVSEDSLDWVASGFLFVDEADPSKVVLDMPLAKDETETWKGDALGQALPGMIFFNGERATLASVCGGLYRRDLIEENRIRFREGLRYGEDTLFNLCFAYGCQSFGWLAEPLYRYHQHAGASTDNLFTKFSLDDFAELLEEMENLRKQAGKDLTPEESNYVVSQTFGFLNHNAYLRPSGERKTFYRKLEETYWSRPCIASLWEEIDKNDIAGSLRKLRFSLIRQKRYGTLFGIQKGIRFVKDLRSHP